MPPQFHLNLNPRSIDEYVGNENVKKIVDISINSCKMNRATFDHTLIMGQRGTGKTTLAKLIVKELNKSYKIISGESIVKISDLINIFVNQLPDILIVDEIHNIKTAFSDMIHEAMDSYEFSYTDEDGMICTDKLKPWTLIGMTTDEGLLSAPFYSRFPKKFQLLPYTPLNLQKIIMNLGKSNGVIIDTESAYEIAIRSFGIPRIAVLHFKNVFEYSLQYNKGKINKRTVIETMHLHGIDSLGLNEPQRHILSLLSKEKKPIGEDNIIQCGIGKESFLNIHEPPLIALGLVRRGKTGREITQKGREHLRKKY